MSYNMSLMGQGIKNIADAKGHGNFSNRQIRHIAELFAYQFPSDVIRKTESTPFNLSGIDLRVSVPSEEFRPISLTLEYGSLLSMKDAHRLHFPQSSSKSTIFELILHLHKCYTGFKRKRDFCLPSNVLAVTHRIDYNRLYAQ